MVDNIKLPLAEHFHSIQGEGTWAGAPMHFIRLAGCCVGKPPMNGKPPLLHIGSKRAWTCHAYDGRAFYCDTDFSKYLERTPSELLSETWEQRVCLTGGEPLMHAAKLTEFFKVFSSKNIHLETSGTIEIPAFLRQTSGAWITVSPKQGVLADSICAAHEIRLLVDKSFDPSTLPADVRWHHNVFLCPVNGVDHVNHENVELAMKWLEKFPRWRLSCQLHKFLGLR